MQSDELAEEKSLVQTDTLDTSWRIKLRTLSLGFLVLIITFLVSSFIPPCPLLSSPIISLLHLKVTQLSICRLLSGELTRPESWMLPLNSRSPCPRCMFAPSAPVPLIFHPPFSSLRSPLIMSSVCPPCCLPSCPPL